LFAQKINNITTDIDAYANEIATSLAKGNTKNLDVTTMRGVIYNYCRAVLNASVK
jgi:hypothetical protein